MSTPQPGDPAVDKAILDTAKQITDSVYAFSDSLKRDIKNLDESSMKKLHQYRYAMEDALRRINAKMYEHDRTLIFQAIGGVQGSIHNHIKNGVHTSKPEDFVRLIGLLEESMKTPPNMDGTIERCGF